ELLDQGLVGDRALDEAQPGVPQDGLEVLGPAGGEVVEDDHLVPLAQERLGEVGADEAGAAGHEGPHANLLTGANPHTRWSLFAGRARSVKSDAGSFHPDRGLYDGHPADGTDRLETVHALDGHRGGW